MSKLSQSQIVVMIGLLCHVMFPKVNIHQDATTTAKYRTCDRYLGCSPLS